MITNITGWLQDIGNYALIGGAILILLSFPAKDKRFKTGYKGNALPDFGLGKIGLVLISIGFSCYGLKKFILWNSTVAGISTITVITLVLFLISTSKKKGTHGISPPPKDTSEKAQIRQVETNGENSSQQETNSHRATETANQHVKLNGASEGENGFGPENFLAEESPELIKALDKEKIAYLTYGGKIFPEGKELPRARAVLANLEIQTKVKNVQ